MMARGDGQFWRAAAAVVCAAGTGTLLATLIIISRLHVPLPYWDEWSSIIDLRLLDQGRYGLADLAGQHNEHRILFPRLVFWADARFFAMSGWLNLAVTVLLQIANAALLLALVRRRIARKAQFLLLAGFVLLLLFSLRQEQNFTNGFQLQFVGVFTAAGLAAIAYMRGLDRIDVGDGRSALFFALAALGCIISAYTMANGILAGFVLAVVAALRGTSWRVIVTTLILSALLAALYLRHYVSGGSSLPLSEMPSHFWAYPRYVTAYLGNAVGSEIRATQALGLLGLVLTGAAAWQVATGRQRDHEASALLAIMGFILASAALTSYGRVALGTTQAFESRYATPTLIFWCAQVLFWFPIVFGRSRPLTARRSAPTVPALALSGLMLLLGGASLWFEVTAWPDLATRSAALRHVSDSLISGLLDADAAGTYENNSPEEMAGYVPYLRSGHLAVFADPAVSLTGRVLDDAPGDLCPGSVSARADPALGQDGVRLDGTVPKQALAGTPTRIVVTDAADRVIGFGSASVPGQPRSLWNGYAQGRPGQELRAFARLDSGRFCALGQTGVEAEPAQ